MVRSHGISEEHFCCTEPQLMLLGSYALYLILCLLLWNSNLLRPLKLFTVFLHELGHAVAVWMTCGKVQGIEVHADHGGLTHWSHQARRIRCASHAVLPAGYLGSATWGGVILVCCSRPATTHMIAMVLIVFLTIALFYSLMGKSERRGDWTLPVLCVGMLVVLVGMLFLCYTTRWPLWDALLGKTLLLVGTMNTLFATYDIWEDCVRRSSERSDACRYAELLGLPMASGRCVGAVWLAISLWMAAGSLLLALRATPPGTLVRGPGDLHVSTGVVLLLPAVILVVTAADRWPAATAALASATGGRSHIRPWASASYIRPWTSATNTSPQPLRDVLLADWRGVDGKAAEHRSWSWQSRICAEVPAGVDVAMKERRKDDEEEVLFFMDAQEDDIE